MDIEKLRQIAAEMRARRVNHGKHESPTLIAWADRIEDALSQQAEPAPALSYKDDPRTPVELSNAGCRCVRFGEGNPHWPCRIHATPAQDEREVMELIDQRDNAEEWANKLAAAIAAHTGADIGEHSNMNCPWAEALEAIENASPAQTEQQHVGWQFYQDGRWWNGDDRIKDHRTNTEAAGYPVRNVYAAPVAQTELVDLLTDVDAFLEGKGVPKNSMLRKRIRAALAAQGGRDE